MSIFIGPPESRAGYRTGGQAGERPGVERPAEPVRSDGLLASTNVNDNIFGEHAAVSYKAMHAQRLTARGPDHLRVDIAAIHVRQQSEASGLSNQFHDRLTELNRRSLLSAAMSKAPSRKGSFYFGLRPSFSLVLFSLFRFIVRGGRGSQKEITRATVVRNLEDLIALREGRRNGGILARSHTESWLRPAQCVYRSSRS
jgi:hypothetical protein